MNSQPSGSAIPPSKARRQEWHEKRHDFFDAHPAVLFVFVGALTLFGIAAVIATGHFFGLGAMLALALVLCASGLLSMELVGPLCPRCDRDTDTADERSTAGTHASVPQA